MYMYMRFLFITFRGGPGCERAHQQGARDARPTAQSHQERVPVTRSMGESLWPFLACLVVSCQLLLAPGISWLLELPHE